MGIQTIIGEGLSTLAETDTELKNYLNSLKDAFKKEKGNFKNFDIMYNNTKIFLNHMIKEKRYINLAIEELTGYENRIESIKQYFSDCIPTNIDEKLKNVLQRLIEALEQKITGIKTKEELLTKVKDLGRSKRIMSLVKCFDEYKTSKSKKTES